MINGKNVSGYPKHWKVRPFSEVVNDSTAGNHKIPTGDYLSSGSLPIIDQGQQLIGGYTSDSELKAGVELPAIIFGDHTRVFKFIDFDFAIGADGAKILEPKNGVKLDKKFLFHYLNNIFIESAGYSRHFKFLKEMYVPLPPLEEQKRIVAILDKADAIRRKRQQAIKLADDFLRSVFLEMFGDPVTNPKGWDVKKLSDFTCITTGNTPSRAEPKYYGDYIEWIKSDNINTPSHFLTKATEYLSLDGYNVSRTVPAGSTLVTCIAGSFDCIGNAAYTDREVAFNQQINALTPKNGINSWFLYALILLSKKTIQAASTNSMKGMLSKGRMEEIELIVPDCVYQEKFGQIFSRYLALTKSLETTLDFCGDLFNSSSKRAFQGNL